STPWNPSDSRPMSSTSSTQCSHPPANARKNVVRRVAENDSVCRFLCRLVGRLLPALDRALGGGAGRHRGSAATGSPVGSRKIGARRFGALGGFMRRSRLVRRAFV